MVVIIKFRFYCVIWNTNHDYWCALLRNFTLNNGVHSVGALLPFRS